MLTPTDPVLVIVAVSWDDPFTATLPNAIGLIVAVGTTADIPVPDKLEPIAPPLVLSDRVPLRRTAAVGVNFTLTVQLPPTANVLVHVVDTKLKSVPATELALGIVTLNTLAPILFNVAVSVENAPICTLPKLMLVKLVKGGGTPTPFRLEMRLPAPVLTVSEPMSGPVVVGAN